MKKKVCNWLDSNQFGGLHVIDNQIQACPVRGVTLIDNVKLNEVGVDEIQQKRKELFEKINCGNSKICEGCSFLVEKEEEDIDIGKIDTLVLHPYTTCNLHCSYCVISSKTLKQNYIQKIAY